MKTEYAKIAETDSIVVQDKLKRRQAPDQRTTIFGLLELDTIDNNPGTLFAQNAISNLRTDLANRYALGTELSQSTGKSKRLGELEIKNITSFFQEVTHDNTILQQLQSSGIDSTALHPQDVFDAAVIPDTIFESMLRLHIAHFKEKQYALTKHTAALKQHFFSLVGDAIQNNRLPRNVSLQTMQQKAADVELLLIDPLLNKPGVIPGGEHDPSTTTIFLLESNSPEEFEDIYIHEFLHLVSGATVLKEQAGNQESVVTYRRKGLAFQGEISNQARFFWLDEAVTTMLTELLRNKPSPEYISARELVKTVLVQGNNPLAIDLFYTAYFEDYPVEETNQTVTAWKDLYDGINQAYSPGFLTRLDKFIKSSSYTSPADPAALQRTIQQVHTDWKAI